MSDVRETEEGYFKELTDICSRFFDAYSKGDSGGAVDISEDLHVVRRGGNCCEPPFFLIPPRFFIPLF
jgi:hypothetical protein